ncbi:hypothetical protein RIF29_28536 [Crotalaria pallida]|uniref:Uncharacterized protein n=1 Tax=Crotalaria pallida TaxID=3830 RepID=A0AAN9EDA7_CROPI
MQIGLLVSNRKNNSSFPYPKNRVLQTFLDIWGLLSIDNPTHQIFIPFIQSSSCHPSIIIFILASNLIFSHS